MKQLVANTLKKINKGDENGALSYFFQKAHLHYGNDSVLEECIRGLYRGYGNLDKGRQRSKAILSMLLYDLVAKGKGHTAAYNCLKLAAERYAEQGFSASELLCVDFGGGVSDVIPAVTDCEEKIVEKSVEHLLSDGAHVLKLSSKHSVYCYKDCYGALVLLSIVPAKDAVLCDEEMFNDEAPLYFTESSHFISPVYVLDVATFLIREIMALAGYPCLRIKQKVLFMNGTYPINDDDMWEEAWKFRDLEVEVIKTNRRVIPMDAMGKGSFTLSLQHILGIVSEHYDKAFCQSGRFEESVREYVKNNIKITRK